MEHIIDRWTNNVHSSMSNGPWTNLRRLNRRPTGTAPSSYNLHPNYIQCCFCYLHTQMSIWKPEFKLSGRVFAVDKEETSHLEPTNALAEHDHLGLPSPFRPPTPMTLTSTNVNLATARSDTSPSLTENIYSESFGDPVHQADDQQRYGIGFFFLIADNNSCETVHRFSRMPGILL